VSWAVIFERYDQQPRHPSQLYEAAIGFLLCGLAWWAHTKRDRLKPGVTVYLLLGFYFLTRFLIEYVKEYQTISESFPFTMGQMLSTPIVVLCALMAWYMIRRDEPAVAPAQAAPAPKKKKGSSGGSVRSTRKRKKKKRRR